MPQCAWVWSPDCLVSVCHHRAMPMIEVVLGDITNEQVDAIVTAANESLLGGGGVDWAVRQAAGPRLAEAGGAIGPCETGDAKATPAFDLDPPVRYIIHAVGPVWEGDRKSTRLNSSHVKISYAGFCLKKKKPTVTRSTSNKKTASTIRMEQHLKNY